MSEKFIDYLTETQVSFEAVKATAEFSEQQKECIEPLQFAYDKAIALITEYDERQPQQLSDGRGYSGSVALKPDRKEYYGRILNLRDVITYKGKTLAELTKAFHVAIDDYEKSCQEVGKEPKQ